MASLPLAAAEKWTWWVEPCTPAVAKQTTCHADDAELAAWALDAWQRESGGLVTFEKAANEESARIRFHWAGAATGLYGEAEPILVNGQRGASIYVLPDLHGLGRDIETAGSKDTLFRDAIVYLTCLHESGHALGLAHTGNFADIMYTFQFGGDILEYFERYRRAIHSRADITKVAGMSDADRKSIRVVLSRSVMFR